MDGGQSKRARLETPHSFDERGADSTGPSFLCSQPMSHARGGKNMKQAATTLTMPLPRASQALGVPWHTAYAMVLSGKLEGEQRGARWFVTTRSVEELARTRPSIQKRAGR